MQIDESIIVKELLEPTTTATTSSGLTPTIGSPLPVLDVEVPPPPVPTTLTAAAPTGIDKPSIPLKATGSLTNLPDISAALRRLSSHTVPASVMEQLSSSPRLPNIGNLGTSERRGSSMAAAAADVSPSEMLGNALAAVAANAAAASRSSPKQPQASNSNGNNAATAIGNLAAITANISNLLHSGGFHRNSFSQEDTQKLAAAVAVARNGQQQQQRRKSSMAAVGTAFSNMIEMMGGGGRNKVSSKPKLIIKNEQVWKYLEGVEEKNLGVQVYSPQLVMPSLQGWALNGLMEVRVPARYLTFENSKVKKRAVWGTDIYTDDSDIVAMAIHCGKYLPRFIEQDIDSDDPFALAVAGKQRESVEAAKKLALSGKKWIAHDHLLPDHDLKVTVRVLPTLQSYASSIRNRIKSRDWGKHDGMSLFVHKVEKIKIKRS
ncbi:histone deacetylation protein Rxt3-domain-containing protein [Helicostylum pulchrum]|nr:histone deacetylation protein Rxt3-domain-containing protein [Helicostylum pulchrum]